jgi:hypothetical protein
MVERQVQRAGIRDTEWSQTLLVIFQIRTQTPAGQVGEDEGRRCRFHVDRGRQDRQRFRERIGLAPDDHGIGE